MSAAHTKACDPCIEASSVSDMHVTGVKESCHRYGGGMSHRRSEVTHYEYSLFQSHKGAMAHWIEAPCLWSHRPLSSHTPALS